LELTGIHGEEFLLADTPSFERFTFRLRSNAGGDRVVEEPWRMAFSYLFRYFGDSVDYDSIPAFRTIDRQKLSLVKK
jgi:hydrogenase maturation factor HypF (carbamoyltransferase family)